MDTDDHVMTPDPHSSAVAGRLTRAELRRSSRRRLSGVVHLAGSVALVVVLLALCSVVIAGTLGYRPLVIRSGSMTPTIGVGAVVVSKAVSPLSVRPGEIVTFRDPSLDEQLVTHRVVSIEQEGDVVAFVTKGDANRTTEHWSVPVTGTVGREALIVPDVGRLLAAWASPLAHLIELAGAFLVLGFLLLRWIWAPAGSSRPSAHLAGGTPTTSL